VKLSVAIPNFLNSLFTDRLIADFESSHPGVKLSVVKNRRQYSTCCAWFGQAFSSG